MIAIHSTVVAVWHTALTECSFPVKGSSCCWGHPGTGTWSEWLWCWTFVLWSFSRLSFRSNCQVWWTA